MLTETTECNLWTLQVTVPTVQRDFVGDQFLIIKIVHIKAEGTGHINDTHVKARVHWRWHKRRVVGPGERVEDGLLVVGQQIVLVVRVEELVPVDQIAVLQSSVSELSWHQNVDFALHDGKHIHLI